MCPYTFVHHPSHSREFFHEWAWRSVPLLPRPGGTTRLSVAVVSRVFPVACEWECPCVAVWVRLRLLSAVSGCHQGIAGVVPVLLSWLAALRCLCEPDLHLWLDVWFPGGVLGHCLGRSGLSWSPGAQWCSRGRRREAAGPGSGSRHSLTQTLPVPIAYAW